MESLRENLPSLGAWLAAPMLAALLGGVALEQAEAGVAQPPSAVNRVTNAISPDDLSDLLAAFDLVPEEAVAWFRAKGVVSPEIYARLDAAARAKAFSVAGLTNDYAVEALRDSITAALREGLTQNDWLTRIEATLDSLGLGRVAEDQHHLRLVFRQNTFSAYSAGRWTQMQRSAAARPFWQYLTVGDENVRPEHAALDGVIKRSDDPFWSRYYPPWDFGCRCTVVSLDAEDLAETGLDGPTPDAEIARRYEQLQPGAGRELPPVREGFGGNPAERFFLGGAAPTAEGREAYQALAGGAA